MERKEERMLGRVIASTVKIGAPENPRFPPQRKSTEGEAALRQWRKPQLTDCWLIFQPFLYFRWRDEAQYGERLNGLTFLIESDMEANPHVCV